MRAVALVLFSSMLPAADTRVADAIQANVPERVAALLKQQANASAPQADGMTALHWAAYYDDTALLRSLLHAKLDLKAATRNGALAPIHLAAKNGSANALKLLLDAGTPVDLRTANGATSLMLASASGNVEAIALLLQRGADVNAKDTAKEQTSLMYASALGRTDAVKLLLAHQADTKLTSKVVTQERLRLDLDGNVVPQAPAKPEATKPDATKSQEAKPTVAQAENNESEEELKSAAAAKPVAAANGDAKKPKAKAGDVVASMGPRDSGATVVGGNTALLFASRDGHLETVRALLDGGANINQTSLSEKASPLVIALINGQIDVADYLVSRGADPNVTTTYGLGALYALIDVRWAPKAWYPQPDLGQQKTAYLDLLKSLLAHKADPNARVTKRLWFRGLSQDPVWVDAKGSTPLWRAAQASDVEAMRILFEAKANPKLITDQGVSPLMVASGLGWMANHSTNAPNQWLDAVKICLENGGDVNASDKRGYTALHGAAYIGDNQLVQFLVDRHAKVDAKTKAGDSPADMANGPTRFGLPHPETLALLEKMGSPNSHNCRSDQCLVAVQKQPEKRAAKAQDVPNPKDNPSTKP